MSAILVSGNNNLRILKKEMKSKIIMLLCMAAVAFVTFVGKKSFESHAYETGCLLMQNLEALSSSDDWSDCPRDKYQRDATESWSQETVKYDVDCGFHINFCGKKIKLGAGVQVGGTVYVPVCATSSGNCCEKSHLDKPYRYP